jgi:hypothetical protein
VQEFQELMPDEETFRLVWQRVMPDERVSPIVVHKPGQQPEQRQPMPPAPPRPEHPNGDERLLREMLEEMDRGLGAARVLVRRQGGRALWESLNTSAAHLRSAWFLLTGRRWMPRMGEIGRVVPDGQLLREQYLRELELSRLYRTAAGEFRAEDLVEMLPELEQASRRRRGMIRMMLGRG